MADSTKLNKDGLNKVWLKVMELIQSLTGNVDRTKGTLQEQIDVKATSEDYGRVKVTNSSAVTDSIGLALAATEKNASIDGTLANLIDELNSNLANFFDHNHRTNYFNGDLNDITENGIVNCDGDGTQNKPPINNWFFVLTMAHSYSADHITQVAFTMNSPVCEQSIWLRRKDVGSWGAWGKIGDAVNPLLSDRRVGYNISFETLISSQTPTYFTNWDDSTNFPELYGSGLLIPGFDSNNKYLLYVANDKTYIGNKYGDLPFRWYAIASQADIDWLTNILNEMKNSRRIHSLWSGLVTSGTQITYNCAISSYPSAKRLIFAFENEEMNTTLSIEIPYYYWEQETNFGSFTKEDDVHFVLLKIIPSYALTDTGCTLTWDTGTQYPFKLASILLEY